MDRHVATVWHLHDLFRYHVFHDVLESVHQLHDHRDITARRCSQHRYANHPEGPKLAQLPQEFVEPSGRRETECLARDQARRWA